MFRQPGRPVRRAYTSCRFGQLHYRHAAPETESDLPPLVMLHQNPSSSGEYEPLISLMGEDREVFAFDTPGNGMSDAPDEAQPLDILAAAFEEGMETLGIGDAKPADLFGYHSGTYLCTELAIAAPARVGRVVLSGLPMRSAEERAANLAKAKTVGLPSEDGGDYMEWLRWLWDFTVRDRRPEVPLEAAIRTFTDKGATAHRRAWTYIGVWSYDAATRLPLVQQPVLIAQPREPLLEPSREAAALFPDATFTEMPDLDRDVFEVGADQFAKLMRSFLV